MRRHHSGWVGRYLRALACTAGVAIVSMPAMPRGQSVARPTRVVVTTREAASGWDRQIRGFVEAGSLRLAKTREDTLLPGRTHERFDQVYGDVRVEGAQIVRQSEAGRAVSVFGTVYQDIDIDTVPALTSEQARARAIALTGGGRLLAGRDPELIVLPRDEGGHVLAWSVFAATRADVLQIFIDARTGGEVSRLSALARQAAVGNGRGVLGDEKKLSVNRLGGTFFATDEHRPPSITTLDLRGNLQRVFRLLDGVVSVAQSDIASDTDNAWTDAPVVDAHAYLGWTYDYFFKRFGRHGLDNRDRAITAIVHPVSRADIFDYVEDPDIIDLFYANAFWCGACAGGMIVFGEGLPPNVSAESLDYFSASFDVVAHELTHGVTEYSSGLRLRNEPGALNEAFSDIMATSAEFFFQGSGGRPADYLMGEDLVPAGSAIRSLADPLRFGQPDHYTRRFTGSEDAGGVHINSTIPSHAFYLAIEGGTNRTSGLGVQGVGATNREQIEKVFYRAFVFLLPPDATFAVARQATLQAATDLYGSSSAAYRAVSQAWDAVGVF